MISYACTSCHKNLNTGTSSTIILSYFLCFSSGIFVVHSYLCTFQYVYSAIPGPEEAKLHWSGQLDPSMHYNTMLIIHIVTIAYIVI